MTLRCSDINVEPLPGTAKTGAGFVLLEHAGPWSHDILDGGTFDLELTAALKKHLKASNMGLQLLRKPGREGRNVEKHNLFLVFSEASIIEHLELDAPADILDLDLSGPGKNNAQRMDEPMLLICTHSKRDVCCALKGRPLAAAVEPQFGPLHVWEASHTKGHRFAPSMLLMPWNYSYGQLNEAETVQLFQGALANKLFLPGNRGRGTYDARGQVAEIAVAEAFGEAVQPASLQVQLEENSVVVTHPEGRSWSVELDRIEVEGVVSSCGDQPKTGKAWVARQVTELSG
ncbi:sucrase ferredoxin [Corynebacterium crudilactis]|uniref:Sucrase ferredoxin n=1 Tax=Corynebacterium crudilactis TaxID=1652495 RepID=A0A172QRJ6_9CORY|nr:sucrase ferredoxin [Corynebacterium crudilactis]ANE03304.1 sucrase ferredoxin [Corynebacterium crudilactis]